MLRLRLPKPIITWLCAHWDDLNGVCISKYSPFYLLPIFSSPYTQPVLHAWLYFPDASRRAVLWYCAIAPRQYSTACRALIAFCSPGSFILLHIMVKQQRCGHTEADVQQNQLLKFTLVQSQCCSFPPASPTWLPNSLRCCIGHFLIVTQMACVLPCQAPWTHSAKGSDQRWHISSSAIRFAPRDTRLFGCCTSSPWWSWFCHTKPSKLITESQNR